MPSPLKVLLLGLSIVMLLAACSRNPDFKTGRQMRVAASNSSEQAKEKADFVCDGFNDQAKINQALSLLRDGGSVSLAAGDYNIGKDKGYGGINIASDNITLSGEGPSTRLRLADHQDCNVIRVYGVNNITVKDLAIDANGENQATPPPGVKDFYKYFRSFQFELSGIMVRRNHTANLEKEEYLDQHEPTNVVISNCWVKNAKALNIMLFGNLVKAVGNHIGDCGGDGIELLIGPGEITGNTVVVSHMIGDAAIGTDKAENVTIADNIVKIDSGASVGYGIRTWHGYGYHVITDNQVILEKGAKAAGAIDARSYLTTISHNIVRNRSDKSQISFIGGSLFTNNIIENCEIGYAISNLWSNPVYRQALPSLQSLASQNILYGSTISDNEKDYLKCIDNIITPSTSLKD